MKKRLASVLLFALTISAGAAFVLYHLISQKVSAKETPRTPMVKVFVATRNIETGGLIKDTDLQLADWPAERSAGALQKKDDIVNRGAASPIQQGWPFSEKMLTPKGSGAGFAATIPKGMRAFTVHVNEVVGVAGFVIAGMRVDVLVSGVPPGNQGPGGTVTRTFLQNIEVLSAGQNFQKDAEGKPVAVQVVNLLVTPAQAEILNLATEQRIQLVLRNPGDQDIAKTPGAATANLFEGSAIRTAPWQAPSSNTAALPRRSARLPQGSTPRESLKPQMVTVEVFAGNKKIESTFQNPEAVK